MARDIFSAIREFLRLESASGFLLLIAVVLAMIAENSLARPLYDSLLETQVVFRIGEFEISKPLLLWINDGLMAIFFFLVGLEIKRELLCGELADPARVALPAIAAVGGMAVPALIYVLLNWDDPIALNGWAIPAATDIALALGVLSLLGKRVPYTLKLFLLTLAIIDDLGAIVIIALFYTDSLSLQSLVVAAVALPILFMMNRRGVRAIVPYLAVGIVLWAAVLKSGVHATLAGVLLAFFIPLRNAADPGGSPLERLESELHPTVAFVILPLFAFANAGVSLAGLNLSTLLAPVPLGIILGLFLGKQIGIFGFSWLAVKFKLARLPADVRMGDIYGVAILCGTGFTMSLFISALAFEQDQLSDIVSDRLGILAGSLISAIFGYLYLRMRLGADRKVE